MIAAQIAVIALLYLWARPLQAALIAGLLIGHVDDATLVATTR
jgi:hypothetical protein